MEKKRVKNREEKVRMRGRRKAGKWTGRSSGKEKGKIGKGDEKGRNTTQSKARRIMIRGREMMRRIGVGKRKGRMCGRRKLMKVR
jgi:hypothetical protein